MNARIWRDQCTPDAATSATYRAVRVRFTHIEPWANVTGISMTVRLDPSVEVTDLAGANITGLMNEAR